MTMELCHSLHFKSPIKKEKIILCYRIQVEPLELKSHTLLFSKIITQKLVQIKFHPNWIYSPSVIESIPLMFNLDIDLHHIRSHYSDLSKHIIAWI
jgi:hypothetical protein